MSAQNKTEEPAFPRDHASDGHNGMSLRDYFAAKVMQGMFASETEDWHCPSDYFKYRADAAYGMADAMLAARGKQ